MTNKYIEGIGLYLVNGYTNYNKVYNALMRLELKKDLKEIEQFEVFINFLVEKNHLSNPNGMILKMTLSNFKKIVEAELNRNAKILRNR